jgi:HK97 family phage major capsid protein
MASKLKELRQRKADLVAEARALLDANPEGLSEEAAQKYDALEARIGDVERHLAREEQLNERERGLQIVRDANEDTPEEAANRAGEQTPKLFESFGHQLQAIVEAAKPGAYVDPRLNQINAAASGGASNVNSDGGYLIQTDFQTEIYRLAYETGILANRVRKVGISANANALEYPFIDETSRATGSRWGGVQVYRVAEADTVNAKKPKIGKQRLELEKLMGIAYATEELLKDASAMTAIYNQAFSEEFAFKLDDEIYNGNGAGQCLGLLQSPALITVSKETGQEAATIVFENILKMWSRLHARARAGAAWFINQDIEVALQSMTMTIGTGGIPVYLPPGGLTASPYGTLLGRPVIPIEHASTLGTVGDILLADLSQYLLIDKGGMRNDTSMHVRYLYDETTFRFIMRVNGRPLWHSAITPYKGNNTQSPYVALATRA